jgi:hypothetical protein
MTSAARASQRPLADDSRPSLDLGSELDLWILEASK